MVIKCLDCLNWCALQVINSIVEKDECMIEVLCFGQALSSIRVRSRSHTNQNFPITCTLHWSLSALSTAVCQSLRAHFCTKIRLIMSSVFTVLNVLLCTEFRVYQERVQLSLFFYLSSSIEKERSSSSLATQAESVRALHNDKSRSAKQKPQP